MNLLIKKLEERFLPEFEKVAEKIRFEIPNTFAKIESHSFGYDEHLGHSFHISCLLTVDYLSEADNVALSVTVDNLTSIPKIHVDVCWGHPSGYLEGEFPQNGKSLIISDKVLEDLHRELPRLYKALFEASKRRKPADEC